MPREGARRRWAVVAAVLGVLVAAPTLADAVPASGPDTSVDRLLERVHRSDRVAWTGYAESVGRLPLPDEGPLDQVADLLGDRSRLRVWWQARDRYRVDTLQAAGERDTYRYPDRSEQWDSGERRVRVVQGEQTGIRVPQPADLLPATLGRRLLAGAAHGEVVRSGSERVAGRSAATLVVTPTDARTLVGRIEVAVDSATGVPLRVSVTARGAGRPTVETADLEFSPHPPDPATLTFTPPPDAGFEQVSALDVGSLADRVSDYPLPATLGGLPRRSAADEQVGSSRTYGSGYALLTVVPLRARTVLRLEDRLTLPGAVRIDQPWGRGLLATSSLLTAITLTSGEDGFILVGTVSRPTLEAAARQLGEGRG